MEGIHSHLQDINTNMVNKRQILTLYVNYRISKRVASHGRFLESTRSNLTKIFRNGPRSCVCAS